MSIEAAINWMNVQLEAMPFFSNVYGLCELKPNGQGVSEPVFFVAASETPQKVKFNKLGSTYFRKRGAFTITENTDDNMRSCDTLYTFNAPLRLFALTKRKEFPMSNAFAADRLSQTLVKALTTQNGQLKTQMAVNRVEIRARAYSTDSATIKSDELAGLTSVVDFKHYDIIIAIDIDIVVVAYSNCLEEACEYIPKFCLQLESYIALP